MKKGRSFVAAVVALLLASPALAQQSQTEPTGGGEAAFYAVGKFISVINDDNGPFPVPAFPAEIIYAIPVPQKYKSKKFFLTVAHSAQHLCDGDATSSLVTVAGIPMFPDPFGFHYFECNDFDGDGEGFHQMGRVWTQPREIDGGPFIPPVVSLIALRYASVFGGALVDVVGLHARREK
jgi:hypothetical protein